ncbi:TPA: hypothetical protein ACR3Z0_006278 [Bacillus thuringiensis]|uniref:Uncharacterized protein n=1 Tax=Bacillus thuringiensis TaxID=1428 RepID=A0A9X6KSW7_BACTU|nr:MULTISPECIES: hypothetical protein [Bacillus]QDP43494.1 hypothetical protein [Bacillus phage vB_BthS-HD29phi]AJA22105.1 hypothetical protein BT4G5_25725 [Bacillus thuringiensis serovar galleriae]ARX68743.1 hypothetical protein BVH75_22920 [Bacillus thuringiensis]ETE91550.1 hypothetical protein C621_0217905 [Bacillus thuringiensis serovar aizawai str. Leapi01]ETE97814.1 hypothetical protein C623_0212455 [Bacillus thuringiensis serovar aizawai str. Hu4-2]
MSYDTVASLQRMQQLEQAQAATGKRLILKRINPTLDIWLIVIGFILFIPTLGWSLILYALFFGIREFFSKTYLVKNVATGEKFRVDKQDFKQYKKSFKKKEKQVRRISDL